jgi:hypothetical protein
LFAFLSLSLFGSRTWIWIGNLGRARHIAHFFSCVSLGFCPWPHGLLFHKTLLKGERERGKAPYKREREPFKRRGVNF